VLVLITALLWFQLLAVVPDWNVTPVLLSLLV